MQDAIKAREDRDRLALEAQSYANDVVPRARGNAARLLADAEAYRAQIIADAEGDASRFTSLREEYEKAPDVTRQRLYYETMEQVLGGSNKVILDTSSGGSLLYLPIDELMKRQDVRRMPGDRADDRRSRGNR